MRTEIWQMDERDTLKVALVGSGNTILPINQATEAEHFFGDNYYEKEVKYHSETGEWEPALWRKQLSFFRSVFESRGVRLVYPQDIERAWLQVFTRDVGFVLGDTFYSPVMRHNVRKAEQEGIKPLAERFRCFVELQTTHLEGGDVFIRKGKVFVGISRQTTWYAFEELERHLFSRGFECIPVECEEEVLHLDCRFNLLGGDRAVIIPRGIKFSGINTLDRYFQLVELPEKGLETLATNYVFLSPKEVAVDERNEEVIRLLMQDGCRVVSIPFTEATKAWGGPRCSVCPLLRE